MIGEEKAPKLVRLMNSVLIPKNAVFPESLKMCGSQVWLAKPSSVLSEVDGCPLDVQLAIEGRRTELMSMDSHKAGRIVSADEARSFASKYGVRIIPTRWVIGPKVVNGKEAVRARCVVQDVAKGSTASSLGISATTPPLEALRTLLAIAATDSMEIATLDVSTAFLHSPLPRDAKAVISLPKDVSSRSDMYAPAYMILDQAMNGLRVAAKAWNMKLAKVVKQIGLKQCPTEPSVFEGTLTRKRFLLLCYVDDLILCGCAEAIRLVTDTLNSDLKIKETGRISQSGGKIVFLGREIERHGEHLRMRVPPTYMESLFETDFCKDLKALSTPPDIVKIIEKGRADPEKDSFLSDSAALRYRAVLGRIAWWGQSRPDLSRWMSILSQGQSKPTACFEHALRQVIRFLKSQYLRWQYYGPDGEIPDGGASRLDVYADASWAPQASLGRRSVSGIAIFYRGCLIKGISRVQNCVSLSSCEAELRAILTAVQEGEGISTLIEQLATKKVEIVLHTDSSSARAVLLNRGLSRRVRRLDIAVCYLQERIQEAGNLKVVWCPTSTMVADIMTKCLSLELFERRQNALGIFEDDYAQKVHKICGIRFMEKGFGRTCICDLSSDSTGECGCEDDYEDESVVHECYGSSSEREKDLIWCEGMAGLPTFGAMDQTAEMSGAGQGSASQTPKGAEKLLEAPSWCKSCKWLFKSVDSFGLTLADDETHYVCGKCKDKLTVTGSAAQHAFNLREKDKARRWSKGESKGKPSEKVPTSPKERGPSVVPDAVPEATVEVKEGWISELGDELKTPAWYGRLHQLVCTEGKPFRDLDGEIRKLVGELKNPEETSVCNRDCDRLNALNKDLCDICTDAEFSQFLMVVDLRGVAKGQAAVWEAASMSGCLFLDVPAGINGLALTAYICVLCKKGVVPVMLVSEHLDVSIQRMLDLLCMLPMIGAERCFEGSMRDQHPGWLRDWQKTTCMALNVVCNGVRWVADLVCQTLEDDERRVRQPIGPMPKWVFFIYSNYKVIQAAMSTPLRDLMTCEATRPVLKWNCGCKHHSSSAYVVENQTFLPWHVMGMMFSQVSQRLPDLQNEMLQVEGLVANAIQLEHKRKAKAQEESEKAKKAKVEEPSGPASAAAGIMPGTPFQLSDDALKRTAAMVTQNLMCMQQQSAPPGPFEGDAASSQEGLSARRKQELLEMQQAAKQRREAQLERIKASKQDEKEKPTGEE